MAVEGSFRGPQVCRLAGITYRQLDYWARTDLIRPSIADARGSGTQRRYSRNDVTLLAVIAHLLDAGSSLTACREAIAYLRDRPLVGDVVLAVGSSGPRLVEMPAALEEVLAGDRVLHLVSVRAIQAALDKGIAAGVHLSRVA